ncbi:MAG: sulfurtransferase TusA family protein [Desulfovibrio sp.]|uniref:sulfurtransferase TusA family protein n=1 Tax=Desulfovibrio sp. TaxID=885 RepID=UPI0025C686E6|nr:sulfurtransferase TusA family protein [Desulfovibrio sp.]MCI7568473.1 sulfurtransferase TusA family protein [Desulfovibrio sp.]
MSTPRTIDASGLSCPQPVLLFLQAAKAAPDGAFVVIVDNEASRENVSRAARTRGFAVEPQDMDGGLCRLNIHK